MSSLSRTYARANKETMKQYQGPGSYAKAEAEYNKKLAIKRDIRAGLAYSKGDSK